MRRWLLLVLLVLLATSGCAYHVRFESSPVGAVLTEPDGTQVALPADVQLKWTPLRHPRVSVAAPGYRTLKFRVARRHVQEIEFVTDVVTNPAEAFGKVPRRVIILRLVPDHGPAGTWSPSDVPRRAR